MKLEVGKQYLSQDNRIWVCYRINVRNESHRRAFCVRQDDSRLEYFYLDGRYDDKGLREHCLVKEL